MNEPTPAGDDPATAAHERRKSRVFLTVGLAGVVLAGVGVWLVTRGSWGAIVGIAAFLLGGSAVFAAGFGIVFRARARRTLLRHPWRSVGVRVVGRAPGGRGKLVLETAEPVRTLVVPNATLDLAHLVDTDRSIEYAGDLTGRGMVFVRVPDGDEVYVATLRAT